MYELAPALMKHSEETMEGGQVATQSMFGEIDDIGVTAQTKASFFDAGELAVASMTQVTN